MHLRTNTFRRALHGAVLFLLLAGAVTLAHEQANPATSVITVSGTVLGPDGRPAPDVVIGYKTANEIRALAESRYRSPSPGSVTGIARMSEAERQAAIGSLSKIMAGVLYLDGAPVGQTDASGAFVIKLPQPGTCIITATTKELDQGGSRQPIVVSAGATNQVGQPIKLTQTPGRKPAVH